MKHTDAIIIGGGQAGLAISPCLTMRGIDHIVLDRGRLPARGYPLPLLSPTAPGALRAPRHFGPAPDGFLSAPEFADYLHPYAPMLTAPAVPGTAVTAVESVGNRYRVTTTEGIWPCR